MNNTARVCHSGLVILKKVHRKNLFHVNGFHSRVEPDSSNDYKFVRSQ